MRKQHQRVGDVLVSGDHHVAGHGLTAAQRHAVNHTSSQDAPLTMLAMCGGSASEFCETCDTVTIWSWIPDWLHAPNPRHMFRCNACHSTKPIRIGAG